MAHTTRFRSVERLVNLNLSRGRAAELCKLYTTRPTLLFHSASVSSGRVRPRIEAEVSSWQQTRAGVVTVIPVGHSSIPADMACNRERAKDGGGGCASGDGRWSLATEQGERWQRSGSTTVIEQEMQIGYLSGNSFWLSSTVTQKTRRLSFVSCVNAFNQQFCILSLHMVSSKFSPKLVKLEVNRILLRV